MTPSSWTMGMSISMITMKPKALANNATVPGTASLRMAPSAAARASAPASTSCFHALVICTAWETPMEKIMKGTSTDIGSMP
ncbi:hypothetical protein D3C76_1271800 [compost metagenome]